MGDRSNCYFRNGKVGIGVYAHWGGLGMADAVVQVLKNRGFQARLGDPDYATRIGVQVLFEALGASAAEETGFGLWSAGSGPGDNEYPYLVIDVNTGQVFVAADWKAAKPSEQVEKPTAAALRKRMSEVKLH